MPRLKAVLMNPGRTYISIAFWAAGCYYGTPGGAKQPAARINESCRRRWFMPTYTRAVGLWFLFRILDVCYLPIGLELINEPYAASHWFCSEPAAADATA